MINEAVIDKVKPGASVKVYETIVETDDKGKEKKRTSRFEGIVISRKHGKEPGSSFTVRGVIGGVGVEKIFPVYCPTIDKVEIIDSPKKVKKAKLYYIRDMSKKNIRKKLATVYRRDKTDDPKKGKSAEIIAEKLEKEEVQTED
ncbi:MAG: 50S ribosomal protein L19 [Candidatus Harrisonbacteria bacterium CG10_big_fil_rev_8_21_14_0_10_38_8]|uniref:50S ribosomal protein L19 n=1 Tax=Candidatus Harrisonbacteria bacterium CG10_big_fil_rev_8_21_14_0_10_38_8 TaxID=1974582 RepID=A0A2M6WJZ7_9BACT|nr:MAG: 50S ribosomal protein L19 [Candidatus Harrisonbacteria bacterium CG10_big_fil_rev_8_21_14_0_10_38_8]